MTYQPLRKAITPILLMLLLFVMSAQAQRVGGTSGSQGGDDVQAALLKLQKSAPDMMVQTWDDDGNPYLITSHKGLNTPKGNKSAEGVALNFISSNKALFKLSDPSQELRYHSTRQSPSGFHIYYEGAIDGLPVARSGIGVHMNKNKRIQLVRNRIKGSGTGARLKGKPILTAEEAAEALRVHLGFKSLALAPTIEGEEAFFKGNEYRRTWKIIVTTAEPELKAVMGWVDQEDGTVHDSQKVSANYKIECGGETFRNWQSYPNPNSLYPGYFSFSYDDFTTFTAPHSFEPAKVFAINPVVHPEFGYALNQEHQVLVGFDENENPLYEANPLEDRLSEVEIRDLLQTDGNLFLRGGTAWPIKFSEFTFNNRSFISFEDYLTTVTETSMNVGRKNYREPVVLEGFEVLPELENTLAYTNAYYHITESAAKLRCLEFYDVVNYPIAFDPQVFSLAPNAFFSATDQAQGRGFMVFYGSDNYASLAEDGEVVVHEYGHAIQWSIQKSLGDTLEGAAMAESFADIMSFLMLSNTSTSEGVEDHLACIGEWASQMLVELYGNGIVYSPISGISDSTVYTSDFGAYCLRYVAEDSPASGIVYGNYGKTIPLSEYYTASQILTSAIYDLYGQFSEKTGDSNEASKILLRLCLDAMYLVDPGQNLTMPEYAEMILISDLYLYSAEHFTEIRDTFLAKQLLDSDIYYHPWFKIIDYETSFGIILDDDGSTLDWNVAAYDNSRPNIDDFTPSNPFTIEFSGDNPDSFYVDPTVPFLVYTEGTEFSIKMTEDQTPGAKTAIAEVKDPNDLLDVGTSYPLQMEVSGLIMPRTSKLNILPADGKRILEGVSTGNPYYFEVQDDAPVTDVQLGLDIRHQTPNDLTITITSPQGTTVKVLETGGKDMEPDIFANFPLDMSTIDNITAFNGESAKGVWVVNVRDEVFNIVGRVRGLALSVATDTSVVPTQAYISALDTTGGKEGMIVTRNRELLPTGAPDTGTQYIQYHRFHYLTAGGEIVVDHVAGRPRLEVPIKNDIGSQVAGVRIESITHVIEREEGVIVNEYEMTGKELAASARVYASVSAGSTIDMGMGYIPQTLEATSTQWHFAEGTNTGSFETYYYFTNPSSKSASVSLMLYDTQEGESMSASLTVPSYSTVKYDPSSVYSDQVFSLSAYVTNGIGLLAERVTTWDVDDFGNLGAHSSAGLPELTRLRYFAEGSTQGSYETYLAISNPNEKALRLRLTFYRSGDSEALVRFVDVAPESRKTVNYADVRRGEAMGLKVEAMDGYGSGGFAVERVTYADSNYMEWTTGHASSGVAYPNMRWKVEGADIRPGEDAFLSIVNPTGTTVRVTVRAYPSVDSNSYLSNVFVLDGGNRFTLDLKDFSDNDFIRTMTGVSPFLLEVYSEQGVGLVVEHTQMSSSNRYEYDVNGDGTISEWVDLNGDGIAHESEIFFTYPWIIGGSQAALPLR